MEIQNALIEKTSLGYEDHGILTCYLHLNYGGCGQGFGGYALDRYNEESKKREQTIYCGLWVLRILKTVGVRRWEDLTGQHIQVATDKPFGKILGIGNFMDDIWFYPEKEMDDMENATHHPVSSK